MRPMRLFDALRGDRRHAQPKPRFEYFEVVRIRMSPRTRAERIAGQEGAIVGMSLERGPRTYAVTLRDRRTWFVHETELEPTGRRDRPEQHLERVAAAPLVADASLLG
jgi:Immunity protein 31